MPTGLTVAFTIFALAAGSACAQNNPPLNELKIRAEAGDRTSTRQIAEAHYLGKGVDQDYKLAAHWYEKLAKLGDARAQTSLGLMYARGYGVEKNMPLAMKWLNLAAIRRGLAPVRRAWLMHLPYSPAAFNDTQST